MQKVSQQKGVSTEIEMKTFSTHKPGIVISFFYNSANSVLLVLTPLAGCLTSPTEIECSKKFIEVGYLSNQKNYF